LRFARGCDEPSSFFRFALLLDSPGGLIVSLALLRSNPAAEPVLIFSFVSRHDAAQLVEVL
jgi:hypothetical protein